ncbi:MAG: hypothetical protein AABX66_00800 [Nanoarchaeota archaeon]
MELTIKEITSKKAKGINTVTAMVVSVAQTTGPTLFTISDGTGSIVVKAFEGPGVRAYADILEGDFVNIAFTLKEFNKMLEGEAMKMYKLTGEKAMKAKSTIEDLQRARAASKPVEFMVKSKLLEKLKEKFIKAATEIRLAIIMNRPIIVRHHNDADGYSSGFALERAILPLVEQQHGKGKALRQYFLRAPSATPFYEIEDSIKDSSHSLTGQASFSEKIPLVIIADTGSGEESLLAIQQGKVHGMDFIVIDHHFFKEDLISTEVLVHINPFLVGEDGSTFSAGMLCAELSRFIHENAEVEQIPAMAGLADTINNPEAMAQYLKIAEKKGYSKEMLADIAAVIDYVSTKLRFMEAREYVGVMFGQPMAQQKKLMSIMTPFIRGLESKAMEVAKSAVESEKVGKTTLNSLYIEQSFSRGAYPKPGRINGLLHDFKEKAGIKNLISIGVLSDAITLRATKESNFSMHDFIAFARKHLPEAFIEGGGHELAGAVRFVPSKQKMVLNALKDFIKTR